MTQAGRINLRIILPFMLVSLIWGSTWLVIRGQLGIVPGPWSVTYRFLIASAGMFALVMARRLPIWLPKEGMLFAAALGIPQFALNFNLVYLAEHHVTSGLVAVIFALLVVPNAVFSKIWLKHDTSRGFWVGSSIAVSGVSMLMLHEYQTAPAGHGSVALGLGLTLCAVLCASIANIVQASNRIASYPMMTMIAWSMLLGALADAVFALIVAGPPVFDTRASYLGGLFYLGLIGSVVTFPLYFGLIRDIGPGKAAYTSVIIPVIAMTLSSLFEDYRWSLLAGLGSALVIAGLAVAMQARNPERKSG
jgi:drug/metabolite transporter (DMT)-like permease